MSGKKLYKSKDKKISGVCGGIAEYFDIDPTIVRLVWAVAALATGGGLFFVAYIVAAMVMLDYPEDETETFNNSDVYESSYSEDTSSSDSDTIKGFKPDL